MPNDLQILSATNEIEAIRKWLDAYDPDHEDYSLTDWLDQKPDLSDKHLRAFVDDLVAI